MFFEMTKSQIVYKYTVFLGDGKIIVSKKKFEMGIFLLF